MIPKPSPPKGCAIVFWDTETCLIAPGRNAPPMVCLSAVVRADPARPDLDTTHLLHWTEAGAFLAKHLRYGSRFVGANVAYDFLVAAAQFPSLRPGIFRAYAEDRVEDVQLRQKIIDIASGCFRGYVHAKTWKWVPLNYSLEDLTRRHTDRQLDKDTWRLRYGELRDLPVSAWPEGATKYAREDAEATRDVWDNQERMAAKTPHIPVLEDQYRQTRGDFALKCTSTWGLRTDTAAVDALESATRAEYDRLEKILIENGLVQWKEIGGKNPRIETPRNTKAAKERMLAVCGWRRAAEGESGPQGIPFVPTADKPRKLVMTDGEDVSLSAEVCTDSEDPLLTLYGEFGELKSVLSKDIDMLRMGITYPIHTHFGIAWSGRTTSSKPNVQNPRRLPGIREAFRPRPGMVFAQADFEGLELTTLAQTCYRVLGRSTLGDAINAGLDPHTDFACAMMGIPYEEGLRRRKLPKDSPEYQEFDDNRQTAKVANFGFPGGLGAKTLVIFAKELYGVILTEEKARWLKDRWLAKWPEMSDYFRWIDSHMVDDDGRGAVMQLFSNRIRGGCTYTAACNTFFQGLGSDAAKYALWKVCEAAYTIPESPLYGSRPVNFIHDEIIMECMDDARAHDVAMALESVMVSAAKEWIPDVRIAAPPLLMRRWSKEAKACYDSNGRLIPWG